MEILVTGFMPFDGQTVNPSWQAVQRMADIPGVEMIRRELPVEYFTARDLLNSMIEEFRPDCVLCTGQAGGRAKVSIERVAINLCEASIPDEAGVLLKDTPIVPGGENAYFSTYPHQKMLEKLQEEEIPRRVLLYRRRVYLQSCDVYRAGDGTEEVSGHAGGLHPSALPAGADYRASLHAAGYADPRTGDHRGSDRRTVSRADFAMCEKYNFLFD